VLSRADLLVHDHQRSEAARAEGARARESDPTRVRDIMTPAVFAVPPDGRAAQVVADMVGFKVHRVFVVDNAGVLVGVISAMDVLRHLQP
jgi:CBS-domain-containing membrane protein